MKKILLVIGTRPNFIKITQFHKVIKKHGFNVDLKIVHTGQHYDYNMSDVFFEQLKIEKPDYFLNVPSGSPVSQIGNIIIQLETVCNEFNPEIMMVVGDVNSTLAASICANKMGIKIAHLESGLRSFDMEMPEEINRVITDKITAIYFVTEKSGQNNLLKENIALEKIHFVGNTMIDTLVNFQDEIDECDILEKLKIKEQHYALMTMHRPRNVDTLAKITILYDIIKKITEDFQLVIPIHPRTKNSFIKHGLYNEIKNNSNITITDALDYFSFQKLILKSKFVITDSGGIQEETTFRKIPCLTLRENTERPSTLNIGTNKLVKYSSESVEKEIKLIQNNSYKAGLIPPLWDGQATKRILEVLISL
ncbi:MAG: UDP-N-acetylglucosamine 2-epimerase (non-hydrolyzing) [Planctomycetota bacterium]|jgi:UDP-N-acetylglucosamine 2-epimerase (non-hydrolysing)